MKFKLALLLGTLALILSIHTSTAFAAQAAVPVRLQYSSVNVTTSAYTTLIDSTAQGIKGVSLANTGTNPVEIAFGASGSEKVVLIMPHQAALAPVYIPISGGYGLKVAVIALDGSNTTGELEVNLISN